MGHTSQSMFRVFLLLISVCASNALASTERFYENSSGSPLLTLLKQAKQTIDIEIYTMTDVNVQAALKEAIARGVRVRIIQEASPVGAACRVFQPAAVKDDESCVRQKAMVEYIRGHGGTYTPFVSKELCGIAGGRCYQHGKLLLVDTQYSLLSTGNFNASNLCNVANTDVCNRDYTMVSTDASVVRTLQTIFNADLNGKAYDIARVVANSGTRKLTVSPISMAPLIQLIQSAKKTIQIQNQYLKDPTFNAALMEAAKRGVKVFINVASACTYATPSVNEAAKWTQIFGGFDQVKINTRIFTSKVTVNGQNGYLHAKAILVDSVRAWVGSVNGSTTSLSNNREYGMFFDDKLEVQKLATFMYNDYMNPNGETWKDSLVCKNDFPAVF